MVTLSDETDEAGPAAPEQVSTGMVSDDLGFLLIFIVLPTALIVSGIWMALFIRRDFSARPSVQPRPQPETGAETESRSRDELWAEALQEAGDEAVETPDGTEELEEAPIPIAKLPERSDAKGEVAERSEPVTVIAEIEQPGGALQGANALSATLLNQADSQSRQKSSQHAGTQTQPRANDDERDGHTWQETAESIDDIDRPVQDGESQVEEGDRTDREEESTLSVSGSTAPLPEAEEIGAVPSTTEQAESTAQDEPGEHDSPNADDQEAVSTSRRRRRQPDARLTRLTEHVRRRGRATGRRVPPIIRPNLRDEDAVEREDGS